MFLNTHSLSNTLSLKKIVFKKAPWGGIIQIIAAYVGL